jgi:glycosyltransferase involved in cell wall biosynthesis
MRWWPGRNGRAPRRAAILVPSLYPGDATGNDAVGMRAALAASGIDARLFAESSDPSLGAEPAAAARDFVRQDCLVVFHQATQWDHGFDLFRSLPGVHVVRDHNVTPPEYFAGLCEDFARASVVGLRQRERFARDPSIARFLAASATNARELEALGVEPERLAVVPPFHRAADLVDLAPDEAALRRWSVGGPTALFVGRLAPNKGHRRALRVAAAYAELFGEPLRLRFVGSHDARWARWLEVLAHDRARLGLESAVDFVGTVSEAELKAAYLTSHVFLCCSEHEGFCVPLVEAASLGVPVVAAHQAAVSETLGREALVVRDPSDDVLAAAVRRVLQDAGLRERLIAAQRRNYAERFAAERIATAFLAAMAPLGLGSAGVAGRS